ncbi:Ig-like domain-containing protein, partial [uncultured Psychrosphaera sp.]|uniref:beta strand repeat-containing protein n=1 Tax=uncultured Psychrosphaera sp. TaxID=1403522 RepID=UPI0030FB79F6
MNITNILQTLFSRLVILTLAVVFLSGCNPEEVLDDGGYEIKLLSTESVFREGEQLSVGVFDKVTGEQDVSANISSNNQSFELDEYVWTTDNSDLAEMALEKTYKNQIITKAPGKVVITATNSKRQVSFELTIAPALLNSVVISPKAQSIYLGQNKSFVVNGNYSDGSVRPITEGISWSIDNNDRASITNQGVVSSLNVGLVKVTASVTNELQQVKTNAVNLTITEAAVTKLDITAQSNIPLGRTGQVSAIAQFTDLTNDNVTTNVSWISTPENIINIDAEGNITTNNMGQVTVSAVIDDGYGTEVTSNSVEITISEKVIETIDIVPENQVILKDAPVISIEKQEQFTVEATYSTGDKEDISLNESLVFTSSDTSIATVALLDSGQFLIETFVEGTTTLTLSLPNRLDEQIVTERVLTVIKPVLTKIDISAQSDTFAVGLQVNWQAIGHYDDNTTKDISDTVTWSSSSSNLASFNQDKRSTLSVTDTGVTSITAQFINDREQLIVSEPAEVTLRSAIVVDVLTISDNANIVDGQVSVPQGVQVNFQLKGMLSDGTEQILSGVTWTATENELATLDSSSGILIATKDVSKLGVLTTTASIFIDDTNFSHDVIVTVTPAKLVSFAIELPENNGLYKGYSQPLKVMGTFSTDLTYDLTDVVTWEINEASKDKIVLSSIKLNTLEMVNAGDVTVSASYLDIYDENKTKTTSLNFTVAPALLTSMSISAQLDSDKNGVGELDVVSVASGQNVLFSAIGTYSDNSTKEITEQVTWLSSSPSFLTIIETGEDGGQANTFEPTLENTALTISALLTNDKQEDISSTFSFTIGDAVLENINLSPAALSFGLNVPAGKSVQLEIWGTYSDGSYKKITEDNAAVWSSNNLEIGTIVKETGLVTMEKGDPAALLITATETVSGNSFKGSLVLNRVDAIVEFIKITPDTSSAPWKLADGAQLNLKAFAVYSDLSEVEITEDENSTWSIPDVSDQAFISVENGSTFKGLVTALTETENKVTVNLQNTTFGQTLTTTADFVIGAAVLEFIEVSPTIQTITSGDTLVFTATGFTSNDETIDLTELATWSSQNINVAEFNQASSNVLQGISAGSVYITASYTPTGQEELTSETQVTVEPAILRSISIHPTSPRFTEIPQNTPLFLKGNTDLLTATGLYSDGTTATINGSVDWSIDNTNVAYISSVGVITPVGLGDATLHVEIEVVELGETKTIYVDYPFTVIGPLLKFIDITPATPVFVLGMQQQFTAKGIYSDNSIVDLTNAVTWTTGRSNELAEDKAGNITNTGVFSAERLGSVTVNASHPDFDDKAIIKQTFVSIETLDHLVIEHAGGDVYAGQKLSLNAYGVTSNNKQVTFSNGLTWQVSAIATIDDITNQSSTNSFTTNAAGVMTATATWTTDVGVTSKSIQIDIKDPLLTSISLSVDDNSIADGLTAQFTATGSYSDGSTQNITDDVSWNNLNESIFTISTTGLITSNQPGSGDVSVYITNESGNKITSSLVTITVELPIVQSLTITAPDSNNTISRGTSAQLSLTGQLTDGTTDLPSGITWESSNELNAIVTDAGLVSIPNDADLGAIVTIKALVPVKNDANEIIEKTIILTVGSAKLTSLTLTTTDQTVPRGSTAQISAMGLLTDDTAGFPIGTAITWSSSDTNKATVNASNGLVTIISNAVIGQKVTITATSPDADGSSVNITQSIVLTIGKPLLTALSLTTSDTTVPRGTSVTIDATGIQSDSTNGISTTITWTTNKPTLSTVSSSGKVTIRNTAGEDETITITASAAAISGSSTNITQSITLTVDAPLLSSMELSTSDTTIPRGTSNAYITATGTYTDTTTKDDPDSLTWSSGNTDIATVDVNGFITILNNAEIGEQVIVTATAPIEEDSATNVTKTITLTVGQPLLTSMTLAALDVTNNEVPGGTSTTITPTGTQSDSTNDIATTITWTTSDASIATVDANGVVTIANGAELNDTVTITATANESATSTNPVTQSILLKVVAPLLSSITLSTDNTTIPRGTTATVSAIGTYTDTSTVDPMTAVWTSSDTAQATVDSSTGVVTIKDDAVIGQQVIITATAPNGGVVSSDIVKTITLLVGNPVIETLDIVDIDSSVRKGRSLTLTKSIVMSDSDITKVPTLTWSSSNSITATVDNGVV